MALTSFCAEGLYGATSFGTAITFNVGWQLCYMLGLADGTLSSLAINLTIMETMSSALQVVWLRRHVDPRLVAAVAIPSCITVAIGQQLMLQLDGVWLKKSLGTILFLMALQRIHANYRDPPPVDRPPPPGLDLHSLPMLRSICFWSLASGLMGGLTSITGPPMMIFMSLHQTEIHLPTWRGSTAVVRLLFNLSRGAVLAKSGMLRPERTWPLDAALVIGGWLGLATGDSIACVFKDGADLHWWMVSLLIYAAITMAVAGSGVTLQRRVSFWAGCVALALAFTQTMRSQRRSSTRDARRTLVQPIFHDGESGLQCGRKV